jgi:hypothetical protein
VQLRALWRLAIERYMNGDYRGALVFGERYAQITATNEVEEAPLTCLRMMALGLHLFGRQTAARPYAAACPALLHGSTEETHQPHPSSSSGDTDGNRASQL